MADMTTRDELVADFDRPMTPVERVRCALAMSDAGYDARPENEDVAELLWQFDRLASRQEVSVDALAQEIRRVDGNNSLGAGALAEALMPFITKRSGS